MHFSYNNRDTASSLQESVRIAGEELRRVSSLHEELLRERRGREEAESKVIRLERQLERNSSVEGSSSLRSEVGLSLFFGFHLVLFSASSSSSFSRFLCVSFVLFLDFPRFFPSF